MKKVCFAVLMAMHVSLLACSGCLGSTKNASKPQEEGRFEASFTEQTVYFESSDELASIDEDKQVYVFKKKSKKAQALKKGSILLIHRKALRKVVDVNTSGNDIVVHTEDATLDELIQDGTLEWTTQVDFNSLLKADNAALDAPKNALWGAHFKANPFQIQIGNQQYAPTSQKSNEVNFEMEIAGYAYKISIKPQGESAQVRIEVAKEVAGTLKGKFIAEGTLSGLSSSNKMEYSNAQLKNFSNKNKNMKGDLTLSLVAIGPGSDRVDMELPVVLMEIPQMVGPIPVFLRVKLQMVISAHMPAMGSAKTAIRFQYDSETGFQYNGTAVELDAVTGNFSIDKKEGEVGAPSPIAISYGIGFPRLEIGVFNKVIVPWVQTAFLIGNDFTPFFPTCRRTLAQYIGAVGYNFEFLGLKMKNTKTLWKEEKVLEKTDTCPD